MRERGRWLARVARWVVPLAAAASVLALVDLRSLGARLAHLDPRFVASFLALSLLFYSLCALRWTFTARRLEVALPFRRAIAEYYLSTLLNQVLPFGVAGDVARAARHRARLGGTSWGPAVSGVVFERASGLLALAIVAGASAVGWLPVAGAVALGGLVVWRWAGPAARGLGADVRAAFFDRGAFAVQALLSLSALLVLLVMFTFAARAAGVPLAFASALRTVPVVFLVTTLPWPFAGWGTREGAAAALFGAAGLGAADGVAASVTFGLLSLVAAAPGLVPLLVPRKGPK
jgi:uncharacterized membrane protein YbhN (UPF0104 family)